MDDSNPFIVVSWSSTGILTNEVKQFTNKWGVKMRKVILCVAVLAVAAAVVVWAAVPSTLNDFFLPGSQPGQSGNIEHPSKCDNCHGGYDQAVEPAFNWRGSMMAQAARDPLFYACLAISNQDVPDAGDLCIRCHAPDGWLQGRSVPTDGSALNNNDREGVQCDFCHKLVKPTPLGVNPYPADPFYTANTYPADQSYLSTLTDIPPTSGNGMYVADNNNAKRGPFIDAAARHQMFYSPFHKDAALCGTCHDVSNPAFVLNADGTYSPNDWDTPSPSFDPYTMFPIERTYSEWLMSAYNSPGGVYAPQFGGNKEYVSTCQDCHMRDVTGYGCNKKGAPLRNDLPLHDMTGGNTFIPTVIEQAFPGETDPATLAAGIQRASDMLRKAAALDLTVAPNGTDYQATVRVTNETGHKLPSGYPEGRRIWINVQVYDETGALIKESGAYDPATGLLTHDDEVKIYEIKPGLSADLAAALQLSEGPSFHFVLNNTIYSDNRIPPLGFTNTNFESIQSPPVGYSYADGQNWDETTYFVPANAAQVVATLYYQTLSKEYVEFLRAENSTNDWGNILYSLWNTNGKSAPVVMKTSSFEIVPVVELPPVADFAASPQSGNAPLEVSFSDLSTNNPTAWSWDFGDGASSTLQNPIHTYANAGVYTVSLTALNDFGTDTRIKSNFITVTQASQVFLHVADMTVTREGRKNQNGLAAVTVGDQGSLPIEAATVLGYFNAPDNTILSGVTDASGVVLIASNKTRTPPGDWCFTVVDIQLSGASYDAGANVVTTACESGPAAKPAGTIADNYTMLHQNRPNPFNPTTEIAFSLPEASQVTLEVYNIMGQKVVTLINGYVEAGEHTVIWDGSNVTSGMYLYRLKAGAVDETRKMLLLK
jgi:PKD repeat protein